MLAKKNISSLIGVLILDDEEIVRNDIKNLIQWEKYGYKIMAESGSAKEALDLLKQHEIQIVIADIEMPGMNGLEFASEVLKRNKKIKFIFLTSYNNFEYVRTSMRLGVNSYILKHEVDEQAIVEELERVRLELQEDERYEFFYFNEKMESFLNIKRDINEKKRYAAENKIPMKEKQSCFLKIWIKDGENRYEEKKIISKILNETSKEDKKMECAVFSQEEDMLCALLMIDDEEKNLYLDQYIESVRNRIYTSLKKQVYILVGEWIEDIQYVREYYKKTKCIYDLEYAYMNPCVFKMQSEDKLRRKLEDKVNIVLDFIKNREYKEGEIHFRELRDYLRLVCNKEYILTQLSRIIENITSNMREDMIDNKFISYHNIKNMNYEQACDKIENKVHELGMIKAGTMDDRFEIIEQYVKKHFCEDISLDTMADLFNITESYMSQLFKQYMGMSFKNYLRKIRMEKAASLILSGVYKIHLLAQRTGYSSTAYFCTVFKSYYGMTPSEYIEEQERNNASQKRQ